MNKRDLFVAALVCVWLALVVIFISRPRESKIIRVDIGPVEIVRDGQK